MAEVMGPGVDDARAWEERLGWAYGLIAADPAERDAAQERLAAARRSTGLARRRFDEAWRLASGQGVRSPLDAPAVRRAHDEYVAVQRRSLPDGLWDGPHRAEIAGWPGLPYALLFLEWEARYPQEWTRYAKAWGTKQALIRDVAAAAGDETVRAKLVDLTATVVRRAYRCKDREYVRVARAVDGEELRGHLAGARESDDPWARLHAGYVLWILDRPGVPNSRHVWRTWLAEAG
jgi:hypothetical protein